VRRAGRRAFGLALASAAAAALLAQEAPPRHGHGGGRYGNPEDLDTYIARLEDPARDAWQKPEEVVAALRLAPGSVACDIGSGPGYFALRLARSVGPTGRVFAVDVEPKILDALRERTRASGARNVTPVLALADDPLLPERLCDVALVVNTYHHFPDGPAYLRRLKASLKPGGRIVNVDFVKKPTPVGPPLDHRVSREDFVRDAQRAALAVVEEPGFLPYQYFVVLAPR
jgi:SAM-dependent methyltransferase